MNIYIDPIQNCKPKGRYRWSQVSHMFIDVGDLELLHNFALSIGLKRAWFQYKQNSLPHYDLNAWRRAIAIKRGAIEVTFKKMVEIMNNWRKL